MEYSLFSSINFNKIHRGYENEEIVAKSNQMPEFGIEDCGGIDSFCSGYMNTSEKKVGLFEDVAQTSSDYWEQNYMHHSNIPIVQSIYEATKDGQIQTPISELTKPIREKPYAFSTPSLELLSKYRRGVEKVEKSRDGNLTNLSNLSNYTNVGGRKLPTEEIIRVAGERYIEFSTLMVNGLSMFIHPYGSSMSSLTMEETRDVELAHLLLAAAEKVGYKQFDFASRLLAYCEGMASDSGNPVKRTVFYFAEALRGRIGREIGSIITTKKGSEEIRDSNSLGWGTNLAFLACHRELPFTQVTQFTAIQAIIDNLTTATKIHLIDLHIRSGIQWTALMQALAERDDHKVEILKITALETTDKQKIEETGKRLLSFADSMNLPFSFEIVFLSDMKDLKEDVFNIEDNEAVAVYAQTTLRTMISRPDCLENLMRVISRLNPLIMVVTEVEANLNSPSFENRFIEALFFYSALFDCLDDCMEKDNQFRMTIEGIHLRNGIQNMVGTEGEERIARSVKMNVWRAFFARFRMVEIDLSESSWYQANLVLLQFSCGDSCTLDNNGKCLIVRWKGTPIHSLSAWKFK